MTTIEVAPAIHKKHDLPEEAVPIKRIRPSRGWVELQLGRLWAYRELLWFLALRDLKVRYKQTVLGALWAVIQPISMMIVFSGLFAAVGANTTGNLPRPIAIYSGLLVWQFFAFVLAESGNSLVANQAMITKIYFPRLIIPIAPVLTGLVDFAIGFLVLLIMMFYYQIVPGPAILALPPLLLLAMLSALAIGLWASALNALYRDIRYVIPFVVQIGMFVTPVVYTTDAVVSERARLLFGLNPMAGVVEGFRWALLGNAPPPGPMLAVSTVMVVALFVSGLYFFRRMEKTFADLV